MQDMEQKEFFIRIGTGREQSVSSAQDLEMCLLEAIRENETVIEILYKEDFTPTKWERIVYRLFRLQVPEHVVGLSFYVGGDVVLPVFEEGDHEWTIEPFGEGTMIAFKTAAAEPFLADMRKCLPKVAAVELAREFFSTGKRPASVSWKRTHNG